jgi:hypothetical protein
MTESYDLEPGDYRSYGDDLEDSEPEVREKKKRKSSAHLRIVFDGVIPILKDASCKYYPEPLWDLDIEGETRHDRAARHHEAKAICAECPARAECLDWAVDRQTSDDDVRGVWGGKVFAPETVSYPRCEVCDQALALSQNPRRKIRIGYVSRSSCTQSASLCVNCAEVLGFSEALPQQGETPPAPEDGAA